MTDKTKPPFKPTNHRIVSIRQQRLMLHVEDALDIGKIRFDLWAYSKGSGATQHADAYLNADIARTLFLELTHAHLSTLDNHRIHGGGTENGDTVARIFTAQNTDTNNPIRFSISHGPGLRMANGLIQPHNWEKDRTKVTRLSILISKRDAKLIGITGLHHMQAWATNTYRDRITSTTFTPEPQAPEDPESSSPPTTDADDAGLPGLPLTRDLDHELNPSNADPTTGELPGDAKPLTYANLKPLSDTEAERKAFLEYVAANHHIPESVEALRTWAVAQLLPPKA